MPPLYQVPLVVALNTQEGYSINPFTGENIQPTINSFGDTVVTGVPVPARGNVIDPISVSEPEVVPVGKPEVVQKPQNEYKIPENLNFFPVKKDSLRTFIPGVDTDSFVLVNSSGDTIPTGVSIPVKGKIVPCRLPQPVRALSPGMKENAITNLKYLDVVQGMTSIGTTSILEDSRGNLWFGTRGAGVVMYNGKYFMYFTEKEGLSNNTVRALLEDSQGNLWIGTLGGGVNMFDGETFTHFTEKEGLCHDSVLSIMEDSHGNLWFGTFGGGVTKYNNESFIHYTKKEGLLHNSVFSMIEDSHGNLWFGTGRGVSKYNGKKFTQFAEKEGLYTQYFTTGFPHRNWITAILEDSKGNLWFGTGRGVSRYDGTGFTHFTEKEGFHSKQVFSIVEDSHGNLWFGNFSGGGVTRYNGKTFTHYTEIEGLLHNRVQSILEDSHGNLWFGHEGAGVSVYNDRSYTHITSNEGLWSDRVGSIIEDHHGNLWFSFNIGGVNMFNGETFKHFGRNQGLSHVNQIVCSLEDSHGRLWFGLMYGGVRMYDGKTFTYISTNEGLSQNRVFSILEDSHGNLWFGTEGGGVSMYDGKTFTHFTEKEGLSNNTVWSMEEDNNGNIWFGTDGGGVSRYDGENFTHLTEKEGLINNKVRSILEDNRGNLWFGTEFGGVSMFDGCTFVHFTKKEGLSDNWVRSILEDSTGNIWLSTASGLNCLIFDPGNISDTNRNLSSADPVISNFSQQDGLKGLNFNHNSVLLDSKNRIWWGSIKGSTMLDMSDFKFPVKPPVIQLDRIDLNGQYLDYRHLNDSDKINLDFTAVARFYNYPLELELSYRRNHLTFHYSAIDWSAPHKIRYSYKIEGLDSKWSSPSQEAKAEYRNLPHGKHTFKVRAIGAAQIWSDIFEYNFTILPPLWIRWWACMIYGFIVLFLLNWYRRYLIKREKITADLRIKEMEIKKMQELDNMKSRFFANVSHEFRTPLTLIQGPIEDLKNYLPDLPDKTRESLKSMKRHTLRLQHLIHQLLDISKLETGNVKLQVSEGNLEQFVRTIVQSFLSLAESKKIEYVYDPPEISEEVFFDSDKLEKILTNLISNAFKFTEEGGQIQVSLKYATYSDNGVPTHTIIEVSDTGRGIPRIKLDRIFDRFYQSEDSDSRKGEGTGLGLALTKELVDLYRGEISVDSQEGKGSIFKVKLPVSKNLFTVEERVSYPTSKEMKPEQIEMLHAQAQLEDIDVESLPTQETANKKPVILIVEDNADLRKYLSRNLENYYYILKAINGAIGLEMAFNCIPDLIISDLMMPEMDGMEMIQHLKTSEITNHIPVIILTAKGDRDSKLAGLEEGADEYMIKPFDAEELRVRVKNLIQQRKKLRNRYRKEFLSDLENHEIPAPEDDFLVRVVGCINKNMAESEFNVEQLGKELGFSRTQLYRKILALTDYTPSEFIRNIRLKTAARMFNEGHKNITRVLYSVGFNTPAYFARCFREVYGINPSVYLKKNELTN